MRTYDESILVKRLGELSPERRAAFAAACASRLFSGYLAFHRRTGQGDPATLRVALDSVWDALAGLRKDNAYYADCLAAVEKLIPDEDRACGPLFPYSDDAAAAIGYAVRVLIAGDSQDAAWAAARAYETLFRYVTHDESPDTRRPGVLARIEGNPLIQAELERQDRDLSELSNNDHVETATIAAQLRARSEREPALAHELLEALASDA